MSINMCPSLCLLFLDLKYQFFRVKGQRNVLLLPQLIVTQNSYCKFFEQNILNIQYSVDATIKLNIYDNLYIDFSEIDGC